MLSQMKVIDKAKYVCEVDQYVVTEDYDQANPSMVICDDGFTLAGIDKGYTGVPAVTCKSIGKVLNEGMDTLGGAFLHEYTHWRNLVVPPLEEETDDLDGGYGPWEAQEWIKKDEAIHNADNFNWFASELFWTVHCGYEFLPPVEPECSNSD
ncbi:hypothetical protein N7495_005427 [Penicillium taxi]|uniref:uncharacterized protein n=1 Tax=Penicillium taxi TaxID=168475 RepID=UPI0025454AD2|nr:uncharacterized protein N7495_005427 [Penicillium taxi]KAJ5893736.1 hypothetical protein N7495_005427 [Penicillium taxi]